MKKQILLLFFLSLIINDGLSQCNVIYVTNSGTGDGSLNNPASLDSALSLAVSGDVLKLDTGIYSLDNSLQLKDSITIEGGYKSGSNWEKSSLLGATSLRRNLLNPQIQPNRVIAIEGFNLNNFLIMRNWIAYAQKIGDQSVNKITNEQIKGPKFFQNLHREFPS